MSPKAKHAPSNWAKPAAKPAATGRKKRAKDEVRPEVEETDPEQQGRGSDDGENASGDEGNSNGEGSISKQPIKRIIAPAKKVGGQRKAAANKPTNSSPVKKASRANVKSRKSDN